MVLASLVETDRIDATYNLTVADFETYFVGEQRVLVHNCKTYQTYTRRGPNDTYSGRTSGTGTPEQNIARRNGPGHPKSQEGYGPPRLNKSSSNPDAIRGREQQLIERNGGARSTGGNSGNAINGVSPRNPNRDRYRDAAGKEFGDD